jgi:hypothetical protein
MILVLSFLVPDAIASTPIEVPYIETIERITAVSARAIPGHTASVNKPRDGGSRTRFIRLLCMTENKLKPTAGRECVT